MRFDATCIIPGFPKQWEKESEWSGVQFPINLFNISV